MYGSREYRVWRDIRSVQVKISFAGSSSNDEYQFFSQMVVLQQIYEKWWKAFLVTPQGWPMIVTVRASMWIVLCKVDQEYSKLFSCNTTFLLHSDHIVVYLILLLRALSAYPIMSHELPTIHSQPLSRSPLKPSTPTSGRQASPQDWDIPQFGTRYMSRITKG